MGKRQISHAVEFPIIYKDSLLSNRESIIPLTPQVLPFQSDSFQRVSYEKGGE